ncbi:unnamed protein product [Linum tenue]|uniref:Rab3-GAP regulatory subunit N-terminal domain-containing protein n=1 Tax=Linum tenue TaxID=586396 RepID=A0AAV0LTU3_9ROSI|nr:unnamed protein product [Linum tenue]
MSRRSHTRELGCIACKELDELGAGKEGWLVDNPNLLCALDTQSIALANKFLVVITGWDGGPGFKIRPELSPIESEHITAMEWLVFDEVRAIAVGTSCGYLLVYTLDGQLVHRQLVYSGRILKLRVRGTKKDMMSDTSLAEEVSIVMPGVIARFDGTVIQELLRDWFQDVNSRFWDDISRKRDQEDQGGSRKALPYQLWSVNKHGLCIDAAITGVMPPPLLEVQSSQRYFCAVTVGEDAVIAAYRLSEDRSRSLVGAILSKVVPAAYSTITSFSKMIWRSEQPSPKKSEAKTQSFAKASVLTCLKDKPRKGEKLTLSPSGTLAAITDTLGRILLLDTQALVVVRLWKGYRDASCLFMEMLINKDKPGSHSSSYYEPVKSDYCLCLAIHAPRKGIVEVWQMRTGGRILAVQCGKGSKILQPTYRFGSVMDGSPYVPLEVFLLDGDSGQISVLNRSLH